MNTLMAPTALREILDLLESLVAALRADRQEQARDHLERALDLLRARPLDCCDRMTVQIVLGRVHRAGGRAMAQTVEASLKAV
jgi:hypothetical protein